MPNDFPVLDQLPLRLNGDAERHIVHKSKRLAMAKVDFNLLQHKIWNVFLSQINPLAKYPEGIEISLLRNEIAELANIHPNNVAKVAKICAEKFMGATFETNSVNSRTGENEFRILNLVQAGQYKNGEFLLVLTPLAIKELVQLQQYGSFNIEHQKNIQSKYTILLHDVLAVHWNKKGKKIQKIKLSINDLKIKFQLADSNGICYKKSYDGMREFKRRVLITAITELNEMGDFSINVDNIEYLSAGRKVTHVILPCSRSVKVGLTDTTLEATERLKKHGLSEDEIKKIHDLVINSELYCFRDDLETEEIISKSITFVEEKQNVNSFFSYIKQAVKSGYAFLPDWANPYSEMYRKETQLVRRYVDQHLTKQYLSIVDLHNEGAITSLVYGKILTEGAYSDYFHSDLDEFIAKRKGH